MAVTFVEEEKRSPLELQMKDKRIEVVAKPSLCGMWLCIYDAELLTEQRTNTDLRSGYSIP